MNWQRRANRFIASIDDWVETAIEIDRSVYFCMRSPRLHTGYVRELTAEAWGCIQRSPAALELLRGECKSECAKRVAVGLALGKRCLS